MEVVLENIISPDRKVLAVEVVLETVSSDMGLVLEKALLGLKVNAVSKVVVLANWKWSHNRSNLNKMRCMSFIATCSFPE